MEQLSELGEVDRTYKKSGGMVRTSLIRVDVARCSVEYIDRIFVVGLFEKKVLASNASTPKVTKKRI